MTSFDTRVSLARWGRLISNTEPGFLRLSYGHEEGSSMVRKVVTMHLRDETVWVARTAAQFHDQTDWTDESSYLTDLAPAKERTVYD